MTEAISWELFTESWIYFNLHCVTTLVFVFDMYSISKRVTLNLSGSLQENSSIGASPVWHTGLSGATTLTLIPWNFCGWTCLILGKSLMHTIYIICSIHVNAPGLCVTCNYDTFQIHKIIYTSLSKVLKGSADLLLTSKLA